MAAARGGSKIDPDQLGPLGACAATRLARPPSAEGSAPSPTVARVSALSRDYTVGASCAALSRALGCVPALRHCVKRADMTLAKRASRPALKLPSKPASMNMPGEAQFCSCW